MIQKGASYSIPQDLNQLNRKEVRAVFFAPKEKGQGLVEYALILVMVVIVVIVVLAVLGPAIGHIFSNIIPLI